MMKMLFGQTTEFDSQKMRVKVQLPDHEDIVLGPYPISCMGGATVRSAHFMEDGTNCILLLSDNPEDGVVITRAYTDSESSTGLQGDAFVLEAGGVELRLSSSGVKINTPGADLEVRASGVKISNGSDSLRQVLLDLMTQIKLLTVVCAAPGSPSGPPVNAPAIAAIEARLSSILSS